MIVSEDYVLTHEQLCGINGKCLKKISYSQKVFIRKLSFLRLWFSNYPTFSKFYGLNRIICLNARAVARRQRQVLEKPKKATFYQNEIYHATKFSEIVIFKCPSVLRIVLLWQESVFLTHEWWSRNNGKYLKNLEKSCFSQNEIYHAHEFSEVVSFRVFQCSRKRMSLIKVYVLLFKRMPRNNGKCFWN